MRRVGVVVLVLCLGLIVVEPLAEESREAEEPMILNVLDVFLEVPELPPPDWRDGCWELDREGRLLEEWSEQCEEMSRIVDFRSRFGSLMDNINDPTRAVVPLVDVLVATKLAADIGSSFFSANYELLEDYRYSILTLYGLAHPEAGMTWYPNVFGATPSREYVSLRPDYEWSWEDINPIFWESDSGKQYATPLGFSAIADYVDGILAGGSYTAPTTPEATAPLVASSSSPDLSSLIARIEYLEGRVRYLEQNCCGFSGSSGGDYSYEIQQLQYEIDDIKYYLGSLESSLSNLADCLSSEGICRWWDPPRTPW